MKISMPNGTIIEDVPEDFVRSLLDIKTEPGQKRTREVIVERKNKPSRLSQIKQIGKLMRKKAQKHSTWSSEDDKYVLDMAGKKSWKAIASDLGRSPGATKTRYYGLKTGKMYKRAKPAAVARYKSTKREMHRRPWSKLDDGFLEENMDRMGVGKLARALKRTRKAVAARIWLLRNER